MNNLHSQAQWGNVASDSHFGIKSCADESVAQARKLAEYAGKDAACIFRCKVDTNLETAIEYAIKILQSQCPESELEFAANVFNGCVGGTANAFVKVHPGGFRRLSVRCTSSERYVIPQT